MANFVKAFNKVIKAEGGYVNDPDDNGGETYLGISRRSHPNSKMWPIIDKIKKQHGLKGLNEELKKNAVLDQLAQTIYKRSYWDVMNLDNLNSQKIAEQLFDFGVNAGTSAAIRKAQLLVGMPQTGKMDGFVFKALNQYGQK